MTILVHTSLRTLGWVVRGAVAVVLALERTLTPSGTLVMSTFTTQYADPVLWQSPPVPKTGGPPSDAHARLPP